MPDNLPQSAIDTTHIQNQEILPAIPKLSLLIIFLLFFAIGGIGGYYLGTSRYQTSVQTQLTVNPIPSMLPNVSPDATANWKSYSNEKYNFEFMYPPNLTNPCLDTNKDCSLGLEKSIAAELDKVLVLKDEVITGEKINGFAIYVTKNELTTDYNSYIESLKQKLLNNLKYYLSVTHEPVSPKQSDTPIQIAGMTGHDLNGYFVNLDRLLIIPFPSQKRALLILPSEINSGSFYNTFNQILSTFKFLSTLTNGTICQKDSECDAGFFCMATNCIKSCTTDADCNVTQKCKVIEYFSEVGKDTIISKTGCE